MKIFLFKNATSMGAGFEEMEQISNVYEDFSKKEEKEHLNWLILYDGVWNTLEWKDYCSLGYGIYLHRCNLTSALEFQWDPYWR